MMTSFDDVIIVLRNGWYSVRFPELAFWYFHNRGDYLSLELFLYESYKPWRNHYVIFDKGLPAPNFRKISNSLRNNYYVTTYEIPGLGVHIWGGSPQHHKYHYDSWWLIDDSSMDSTRVCQTLHVIIFYA